MPRTRRWSRPVSRRVLAFLKVEGVRNLAAQEVPLDNRIVVLMGDNAQGKSALLEAAYMLATTRSFRCRDPRQAICWNAERLTIHGKVLAGGDRPPLTLALSRSRRRGDRRLLVGECEVELAEYLGVLPALAMTGDSSRSIAGSPKERRRYIDRGTAAARPEHLQDLSRYRRALSERNALLRQGAADEAFEPWEAILAGLGESIRRRREEEITAWQAGFGALADLFPEAGRMRLVYRETGNSELREELSKRREDDRRTGVTASGPHRDDFLIEVDGHSLWAFGSAGQIRSALAATTLAQAARVRESRLGSEPLLVLDDLDSDLDSRRLGGLLEAASGLGQVLAATCKPGLPLPSHVLRLVVSEGKVSVRKDV
ncbi:MAG: DNA replication and repair protein RecF [Acidobacteriota bacterium]|nr:DNA replication and repair protein RecF [Acidobacteriota bacterium]MDQ7087478.1 DNA replication and repair protein RecF [Acidobacteriota bacterium]